MSPIALLRCPVGFMFGPVSRVTWDGLHFLCRDPTPRLVIRHVVPLAASHFHAVSSLLEAFYYYMSSLDLP